MLAPAEFSAQSYEVHPDDLPPLGEIVVPDDARDLDREVLAYQRELRAARRAARYGRLLPRRFRHSPRAAATVAVTVALVLAVLAGLVAVIGPGFRRANNLRAAPLASPTVAPGRIGGLLPEISLSSPAGQDEATTVAARALRPAAVVLVPAHCSCGPVVADVLREAGDVRLGAAVVASGTDDGQLAALADPDPSAGAPAGEPLLDTSGTLARDYGLAASPVLLAVDEYGVVQRSVTLAADDSQTETAVRAVLELVDPTR